MFIYVCVCILRLRKQTGGTIILLFIGKPVRLKVSWHRLLRGVSSYFHRSLSPISSLAGQSPNLSVATLKIRRKPLKRRCHETDLTQKFLFCFIPITLSTQVNNKLKSFLFSGAYKNEFRFSEF